MKAAVEEKKQRDLERQKIEEERIQEVYKIKKAQGEAIKADEAIKAAKEKEKERQKAKKVSQVLRTN